MTSATIAMETPAVGQMPAAVGETPAVSTHIKWGIVAGVVVIHLGALLAPFTFTWSAFWVFIVLQFATGLLGITLCFHRLLAHRSFQVPKWLEYALTICGSLAAQGGPIKWVSTHRVHHAFSDRPQDPHSPTKGFWWAHVLWLFPYDDMIDHPVKYKRFAPDLAKDRGHQMIEETYGLQTVLLGTILFAIGGMPWLTWGLFLRIVFVWHITWLVNSAAHLWGYQTYNTNEGSRNNWWVALISYGEGWHNNHHAYLHSAAHGLRWWEFDLTYLTIRVLAWMKLATRIRLPRGNPAKLPEMPPISVRPVRLPIPTLSST